MVRAFAIVHICMHKRMIKILRQLYCFTSCKTGKIKNNKALCLVIYEQKLFLEFYRCLFSVHIIHVPSKYVNQSLYRHLSLAKSYSAYSKVGDQNQPILSFNQQLA